MTPGAPLEIEADPNAEAFYRQMGCVRVGEVRTDWQGLTRTLPLLRLDPRAQKLNRFPNEEDAS